MNPDMVRQLGRFRRLQFQAKASRDCSKLAVAGLLGDGSCSRQQNPKNETAMIFAKNLTTQKQPISEPCV
jgi:hypothetical protein